MTVLGATRLVVSGAAFLGLVVVSGGCGSADGTGEWAGHTSSDLLCQSEGIHIEGCPIQKPPPPVPPPCPAGDTCQVSAVGLAPPASSCTAVQWFAQTGASPAQYAVATCTAGSVTSAWVSSLPSSWSAVSGAAVPTMPLLPTGQVYVTFLPPTPTSFPTWTSCGSGSCTATQEILGGQTQRFVNPANGVLLPCTVIYDVPSTFFAGTIAAYCVETPGTDSWAQYMGTGGGCYEDNKCSDAVPMYAPPPPYGYVYLWIGANSDVIGGGCGNACRGS